MLLGVKIAVNGSSLCWSTSLKNLNIPTCYFNPTKLMVSEGDLPFSLPGTWEFLAHETSRAKTRTIWKNWDCWSSHQPSSVVRVTFLCCPQSTPYFVEYSKFTSRKLVRWNAIWGYYAAYRKESLEAGRPVRRLLQKFHCEGDTDQKWLSLEWMCHVTH